VAGVVLGSWLERQNLVMGMLTGRKHGPPEDAIGNAWRSVAVLMVAAVLGFWVMQWQVPPPVQAVADQPALAKGVADREHDAD